MPALMVWRKSLNARIDGVEKGLNARIDETNARIDGVEKSLGARIDALDKRMDNMWRLMMGLFGLVAATIAIPQIIVAYRARGPKEMQTEIEHLRERLNALENTPIIISVRRLISVFALTSVGRLTPSIPQLPQSRNSLNPATP